MKSVGASGGRSGPRVLHIIPGLGASGGAERSVTATAGHLVASGIDLHVAVLTDRDDLAGEIESSGVGVHRVEVGDSLVKRALAIRSLVNRLDPDLVHTTLFDADLPAQLAVGRTRPILVTWAGTPFVDLALVGGQRRLKLEAVRFAQMAGGLWSRSHYQAVTRSVASLNGSALRVRDDRVSVATRGRPHHVPVNTATAARLAHELELDGAPMVLVIGRHEPEKDLPTAIRAFASVSNRVGVNPPVLVIAGRTGSASEFVHSTIRECGLVNRVRVLGSRHDVAALLDISSVVVSSSVSEGAAGAIIEAMAAAKPLVVTDAEGPGEMVRDGVEALVVPRRSPSLMGAAIERLLVEPEVADALGREALRRFEGEYSDEMSAARLEQVYRSLASHRRVAR